MPRPVTFREAFPIIACVDLDAALTFYQDLLGFTLTYRWPEAGPPEFAALALGDAQLGLGRRGAQHSYTRQPYASGGISPVDLCIYVDDLDAALSYLQAHGVPVLMPPATQPWGERISYVADPDGNQLLVIETPPAER